MSRICALNENYECVNDGEDAVGVSGEAEESVAISEYFRALKLKNSNKNNNALHLLLELIETDVLTKIIEDSKDNKLFLVKYNSYRNIGLIYRENEEYEMALHYFNKAIELDDTDVHTLFCVAQLALRVGQVQIAQHYYEKCVQSNPNHWPSIDGLLQALCRSGNVSEAFAWAIQYFNKDASYTRSKVVLDKIQTRFHSSLPFLIELHEIALNSLAVALPKNVAEPSYFNESEFYETLTKPLNADANEFTVNRLDWLSFAGLMIKLRKNVFLSYKLEELIDFSTIEDGVDYSSEQPMSVLTDSDSISNSTTNNADLPSDSDLKSRRRGSELKILEQWGWHKSRKSSRKKGANDTIDSDESSVDGFMKRTLSQFFAASYEPGLSPFSEKKYTVWKDNGNVIKKYDTCSLKQFELLHRKKLVQTVRDMQSQEEDACTMAFHFAHTLSLFWNEYIPEELRVAFVELYESYGMYEDCQYWQQFTEAQILSIVQVTLFYLELQFDHLRTTGRVKIDGDSRFVVILNNLQLHISYLSNENYVSCKSRYLWLKYSLFEYENNTVAALSHLEQVRMLFLEEPEDFAICLPNILSSNYFDLKSITESIYLFKRQISLSNVQDLYAEKKCQSVINIIVDNLMNVAEPHLLSSSSLSIPSQIEILLEMLWEQGKPEDCFKWAEKALKYATDSLALYPHHSSHQISWAKSINFLLLYIHEIVEQKEQDLLQYEHLPRLVQSIHKLLTGQLDVPLDKSLSSQYVIECWRAWMILYYILERCDEQNVIKCKNDVKSDATPLTINSEEETLCYSTMVFFVAHELLGRRQWCSRGNNKFLNTMLDVIVPKLRSPLLEPYRDVISECLEQTTFCLYGYPPKKGRMRHIQEHDATPDQLTCKKAIQLFEIYRPEVLPEFNSYRIDSISSDMEALLQHILLVLPENNEISQLTQPILDFIEGSNDCLQTHFNHNTLSFKVRCIYYLLADYYFKNRDFTKAINYYIMDLTIEPTRFDSWAGMALSKASKCETSLDSTGALQPADFLREADETMRCFEYASTLNENDLQLRVEHGSFAYLIYSYCSRILKSGLSPTKSCPLVAVKVEHYARVAFKCFSKLNDNSETQLNENHEDEQWLYHYMLGKIAEKKNEEPTKYLAHYLKSATCLYEHNATYPIKVNHNNPSHLSIEALELFYRTNAAIIKYIESHPCISKSTGGLFRKILNELAVCPFAVNRAKINDISLKRKFTGISEQNKLPTTQQSSNSGLICKTGDNRECEILMQNMSSNFRVDQTDVINNDFRRTSQESSTAATGTTTTSTTSTSNATSSISSDTDSPNSESDTDDEVSISDTERDSIFKVCIKNLEECVTRFPEHYKSIYRLAYHYMNAPGSTQSYEKCRQLLLGSYKTALGNQIAGLFTEKRSNNFFNGIWRIPSSDIERPGSFASHLTKCVILLMVTLKHFNDHEALIDLAIHLYRTPDTDKKYLNDEDRTHLFEQSVDLNIHVFYNRLNLCRKNDYEMLSLLIDIFKAYRKCNKHIQAKEADYANALVESYKIYIHDKAKLPDNANVLDLALKLCTYEINYRKSKEKLTTCRTTNTVAESAAVSIIPMQPISSSYIPGLTKQRRNTLVKPKSAPSATVPIMQAARSSMLNSETMVTAAYPARTEPALASTSYSRGMSPASLDTLGLLEHNPMAAVELSRMYFNVLSSISGNEQSFDFARMPTKK